MAFIDPILIQEIRQSAGFYRFAKVRKGSHNRVAPIADIMVERDRAFFICQSKMMSGDVGASI